MRVLNIILGCLLIGFLGLTMFFFLNPFTWFLRREERYDFPEEFTKIEVEMSKDLLFGHFVSIQQPTQWYIKDCERGHLEQIENLTVNLGNLDYDSTTIDSFGTGQKVDDYAVKILKLLPKRMCFDSLVFEYTYWKKDSILASSHQYVVQYRKYPIQK